MIKLMMQKKIRVTGEKEVVKELKKAMRNRPEREEIEKNTMVPPLFHLASYAVFLIGWMFRGSTVVFLTNKKFNPTIFSQTRHEFKYRAISKIFKNEPDPGSRSTDYAKT